MSGNAQIDIRGNPTRRVIDLTRRPSMSRSTSEPWAITIAGGLASFANCCYKRMPVFFWLGDIPGHTLVKGADGVTWVSAKVNTETGAAEIVSGNFSAVTSATVPTDEYVFLPLYKLAWVTVGESTSYSVTLNLVSLDIGGYV